MAAAVLVTMSLAAALLAVLAYLVAGHAARGAADLVALSGAAALVRGGDGCRAARTVADENAVAVISCQTAGDSLDFVVSVTVSREVDLRVPGLPRQVRATAHAGRFGLR